MPDEAENARKGKIASLSLAIRSELNRRLDDGQRGPQLLPWLNNQAEVLKVLDELWGEQPISPQNLTEWRQGGYQDHVRRRERVENLKVLSEYALKLGQASGGSIADGSAAIAGGKILLHLESLAEDDLESLDTLVSSLALVRQGDQEKEKINIRKQTIAQRDQVIDLSRKRFQRTTCELFLKWYDDERAKKVVESRASNSEKLEQLGQEMFGEDW
jgi:hypothetical protein